MAGLGVADGADGSELMLEREDQLDAMARALRETRAGRGSALFLIGTAGIGKTTLLAAGARRALSEGMAVGYAVGSRMERELPFGVLSQALASLGGVDELDLGELALLGGPPARMYRTLKSLRGRAEQTPLALALDDLHWADPDSVVTVGFLARRISAEGICVIGALRPEPGPAIDLARELAASGQAELVELAPLSPEGSLRLVERAVEGAVPASQAAHIRACSGNPLLLESAAATIRERGRTPAATEEASPGSLLVERFVGFDERALDFLAAGAVLGVRFDASLAGELASITGRRRELVQRRLVESGLLRELGGGSVAFAHPLFAQVLLERRPASHRERLHEAAFRALLARGAQDALAAPHAVAARMHEDPLAVSVLWRAGRGALAEGAAGAASVHLGHAVEFAGARAEPALLLDLAEALAAGGDVGRARELSDHLLAREHDLAGRVRALVLAARCESLAVRPRAALLCYEEAARIAELADAGLAGATLVDAALTCYPASPIPWVVETVSRALELIPPSAPQRPTLEALDGFARLMGGDASAAGTLEEVQALPLGSVGGGRAWDWTTAGLLIQGLKVLERFDEAGELFERVFPAAAEAGAPLLLNVLANGYADLIQRQGRPQEALEIVREAQELCPVPLAPWTDMAQAYLLTELGEDDLAEGHLAVMRSYCESVPEGYYASLALHLDLIEARRHLAAGAVAAASERMLHAEQVSRVSGWVEPSLAPWPPVAIEAHVAAERPDLAKAALGVLDDAADALGTAWPRAEAALGRARVAAAEGDHEAAEGFFGEALALFATLPLPMARAEAMLAHGTHLRRVRRPSEARERLREAREIAVEARSERLVAKIDVELRAAGARRRRRDLSSPQLTDRERQVAALAAEGLTNTAIARALTISARTVDHHLGRVYAKLGIPSRRELIARAAELL